MQNIVYELVQRMWVTNHFFKLQLKEYRTSFENAIHEFNLTDLKDPLKKRARSRSPNSRVPTGIETTVIKPTGIEALDQLKAYEEKNKDKKKSKGRIKILEVRKI